MGAPAFREREIGSSRASGGTGGGWTGSGWTDSGWDEHGTGADRGRRPVPGRVPTGVTKVTGVRAVLVRRLIPEGLLTRDSGLPGGRGSPRAGPGTGGAGRARVGGV
ncbi:hypothetical protein [Streptomyces xinghaiensis]|uniref:hypothetical protein n=1 Tax=Streptomyces xinghaiensis TaxID=1038928 RepID=UPI002E1321F2|nr:hypothetical protein OG463_23900 [Streptomyces xinghaiensis]